MLAADDPEVVDELFRAALPLYFAYPDRPDVAPAIDELRGEMRGDLAAAKAWENGLYQTIDLRPLLPRIDVPTLIVAGELDIICGPAQARPIAAQIRAATLRLIRECGHWPATETPAELREIVAGWLA